MLNVSAGQQLARRARHTKSRTGCLRCKQRHVRCDEGKPRCQRCIKINVTCPGYDDVPKARIFGLSQDECLHSDFEKVCLQSFTVAGNKRLLSLQPAAAKFRQIIVLQLGDIYPAIRHATIAISLLQEPRFRPEVKDALAKSCVDVQRSVLLHFNESIRSFMNYNQEFRVEAKLACCLLYHTLEVFQENLLASTKHIRAADFILKDHVRSARSGDIMLEYTVVSDFSPLVQQHILDASTYVDDFQTNNMDCGNRYEIFQGFQLRQPESLTDIDTTYNYLATIIKYAVGRHLDDFSDVELIQTLDDALENFEVLLERSSLEPAQDTAPERLMPHALIFKVQHQAAIILARTKRSNEFCFDHFEPNFERIVNTCKELLPVLGSQDMKLPLGIIPPLFLTATKCRTRELRKEANCLLHSTLRVEHNWTSCVASSIGHTVIELENELNSTDERCPLRLRLQNVELSPETGQICLTYDILDAYGAKNSAQAYIPYSTRIVSDNMIKLGAMQHRALWAAGYSGVQFFSPGIQCHCAFDVE